MSLTNSQKKYIKKNTKRYPLEKIAKDLNLPQEKIEDYVENRWGKKKLYKISEIEDEKNITAGTFIFKTWFSKNYLYLLLLALLVFASYANSLNNAFVSDDRGIILSEPLWSFSYIISKWTSITSTFLYFVVYKIGGLNPLIFRTVNILFHIGTVCFIYMLFSIFGKKKIGLFTASIFAVHPLLTEAVSWISGVSYVQYTFFFLLSFIFYVLSKNNTRLYIVSLLSFLLMLISSEKSIVLFLIFPLFELSFGNLKQNWKRSIPYAVLAFIFLLYLFKGGVVSGRESYLSVSSDFNEKKYENPLYQIPISITSYFELFLWPSALTLYHSEISYSYTEYFIRLFFFLIFVALVIYSYFKNRHIFFWFSLFFISLLPTLTPLRIAWVVAERYVYLGTMGLAVVAAIGFAKLTEIKNAKTYIYVLFFVVVAILSTRTIVRNNDWKNEDSLWLAADKTSPSSPQNHNNLGDYYGRHGNNQKAVEEFQTAIRLKPNYADAYHNMGNAYLNLGKIDEATESFKKALSFNSGIWQSYHNLAAIYFQKGEYKTSLEYFRKGIKINPSQPELYVGLAVVYEKLGKVNEAKQELVKVLQAYPDNTLAKQVLAEIEKKEKGINK